MERTIEDYGIRLRSKSVGNHKTICPQCSSTRRNKKDPCLSVTINSDGTAVWNCHHCDFKGGTGHHRQSHFKPKPLRYFDPPKETKTTNKLVEFFKNRKITEGTLMAFGVYNKNYKGSDYIVMPYKVSGKVTNNKYRSYDKRFMQEKDATPTLYNIDSVLEEWKNCEKKTIIFVEGEMDVMALWEAGYMNAVSFPTGAPQNVNKDMNDRRFDALKQHEWLDKAERIILAFDSDLPGRNMRDELIFRFGADKCYQVDWSRTINDIDLKDANDHLIDCGADSIRNLIENATPCPIDGLHMVSEYSDQVESLYDGTFTKPFSAGFDAGFDDYYMVLPGTFHVVTGIPNHGKSNFTDQILIQMAKNLNWRFAVFSPEHRTDSHIKKLIEKHAQKPFSDGFYSRIGKEEMWRSFEWLNDHFYFIESKDQIPSIDWLLEKIKSAHLRYGINGFLIDPYNEIDASRPDGMREDEHIRDLISKIKRVCQHNNLVCWLVAHPAKMKKDSDGKYPVPDMYDISGSAHWYNMTDAGLSIYRDFETNKTTVHTKKIRDQDLYGSLGEMDFRYDTQYRSYYPSLEASEDSHEEPY